MTPQTSTQPQVMNVHNGDNHELVQQFDEVVFDDNLQPHVTTYPKHVHHQFSTH
jgi:hypothetical protein